MKWRKFPALFAIAAVQALIVSFALGGSAHAATPLSSNDTKNNNAVFFYDPKDAKDIASALKGSNALGSSTLGKTSIYVKNSFFGSDPFGFFYDNSTTSISGVKNPYYMGTYYCTTDGKVSASGIDNAYKITLAAAPNINKDFNSQNIYSGSTVRYFKGEYNSITNTKPAGVPILGQDLNINFIPTNCLPPGVKSGAQPLRLVNYNKLSTSAKKEFPNLKTSIDQSVKDNAAANQPKPKNDENSDEDNCSGVFGWAICPMLKGAEDAVGWIEENFIAPFYHTDPLRLDCGSISASERASTEGCAEYNVWVAIRNLSNIFFVLIFLAFIFANTLSFNLDSYAVKKMLPKLIAAVIIVQFSYLFMAFAIDITNVLGQGIGGIIDAAIPKGVKVNVGADQAGAVLGVSVAVGAAAAVGVATAISSGAIWVVIALAFLAMLGVFFTLIFRQILIVMLVISAPIAIACMVLPNTEKVYKLWLNTLIKVLLMYPLIMLIFGSSKLLSLAAGINGGAFASVIRLVVIVIPLFLIPFTFKWAGGIMNAGASAIQKRSAGYGKKVNDSDWAKERRAKAGVDKRSLAAGTGISVMGRNMGSGRAGRFLGRTTAIDPGGTRARSKLNTDRGVFDKQMDAANLSHDDLNMAIGGRAYRDEQIRLAGNDQTKKSRIEDSYNRTKAYHGNKVAAQAAALRIADQGGVTNNTRTALKTAFGPTPAGMAAGAAVWGEVGRKAGDKQLHLQAVNFNTGDVEISKLQSKVAGKDAKKLAGQGTDFWRAVQTAESTPGVGGAGSVLDPTIRTQLSAPGKLSAESAGVLAGTGANSNHWGGEASNPTINVVP